MNFEQYLRQQHVKERPQVLDDELPDDFEHWLMHKDADEIIKYGNEAIKQGIAKGKLEAYENVLSNAVDQMDYELAELKKEN